MDSDNSLVNNSTFVDCDISDAMLACDSSSSSDNIWPASGEDECTMVNDPDCYVENMLEIVGHAGAQYFLDDAGSKGLPLHLPSSHRSIYFFTVTIEYLECLKNDIWSGRDCINILDDMCTDAFRFYNV